LHGGPRSTGATDPEVSGPQSSDLLSGSLESGGLRKIVAVVQT
jgi:hypothetical protein